MYAFQCKAGNQCTVNVGMREGRGGGQEGRNRKKGNIEGREANFNGSKWRKTYGSGLSSIYLIFRVNHKAFMFLS